MRVSRRIVALPTPSKFAARSMVRSLSSVCLSGSVSLSKVTVRVVALGEGGEAVEDPTSLTSILQKIHRRDLLLSDRSLDVGVVDDEAADASSLIVACVRDLLERGGLRNGLLARS